MVVTETDSQAKLPAHAWPHAPQFFVSLEMSTDAPLQQRCDSVVSYWYPSLRLTQVPLVHCLQVAQAVPSAALTQAPVPSHTWQVPQAIPAAVGAYEHAPVAGAHAPGCQQPDPLGGVLHAFAAPALHVPAPSQTSPTVQAALSALQEVPAGLNA